MTDRVAREPPPPPAARRAGHGLAALLFLGVVGLAAALGFRAYRVEVDAHRAELQQQMQAVARLKAAEIEHWIDERRADVEGAATGSMMAVHLERWQATRRIEPQLEATLAGRLELLRRVGGYAQVLVLDREGRPLLSRQGRHAPPFVGSGIAREAMTRKGVLFSPLHRPEAAEDGPILLDAISPLTIEDASGSRVVGALVYRIDPEKYLFPLIRSWPTDSPSAESLLVEAEGDRVTYLNELRHLPGAPMRLRLSARDPELVAAKALRGERGVAEGLDYRGVPVLASIEEVRGTPWILVSKVDRREAYEPLRPYLWAYLVFLVSAVISAALAARAFLVGRSEAALRREHERTKAIVSALEMAEEEREKLIESLSSALDDVKTLRGIVPICASCKRIRDDAGYWSQVEQYVSKHTEAQFSHGICPECAKRLYPEYEK